MLHIHGRNNIINNITLNINRNPAISHKEIKEEIIIFLKRMNSGGCNRIDVLKVQSKNLGLMKALKEIKDSEKYNTEIIFEQV